jgi:hypothetical protein
MRIGIGSWSLSISINWRHSVFKSSARSINLQGSKLTQNEPITKIKIEIGSDWFRFNCRGYWNLCKLRKIFETGPFSRR